MWLVMAQMWLVMAQVWLVMAQMWLVGIVPNVTREELVVAHADACQGIVHTSCGAEFCLCGFIHPYAACSAESSLRFKPLPVLVAV